jgi:hypothetical protein
MLDVLRNALTRYRQQITLQLAMIEKLFHDGLQSTRSMKIFCKLCPGWL